MYRALVYSMGYDKIIVEKIMKENWKKIKGDQELAIELIKISQQPHDQHKRNQPSLSINETKEYFLSKNTQVTQKEGQEEKKEENKKEKTVQKNFKWIPILKRPRKTKQKCNTSRNKCRHLLANL
jgi:hypothetical protein